MEDLQRLAFLIKQWNAVGTEIAAIIGRPAQPGHIGEFVAAAIFDVDLLESASHKGIDGHFTGGSLVGRSVNIKYSAKNDGLLNITLDNPPDYYLVLAGPKTPPISSRGTTRPWTISSVFLFNGSDLVGQLNERGVKIGVATSVANHLWHDAEIYPSQNNKVLKLTETQRTMIELLGNSNANAA